MPKKIILATPHNQIQTATEYILKKFLITYETDSYVVLLDDEHGRQFNVSGTGIPATTQEQAILALINNGLLAGTITDV